MHLTGNSDKSISMVGSASGGGQRLAALRCLRARSGVDFTIDAVPSRVETMGDLWVEALNAKHDLTRLLERE